MILMIDNYDSFTYNLVQYLGELGQDLKVFRNDRITVEEVAAVKPARIVISPGPGSPDNAGVSLALVSEFAGEIPILGVCLGHQAIAQAFGGRIMRAPVPVHGKTAEITHDGKAIYQGVENPFTGTRYHSLVVEESSLPDCFDVSARAGDVVMGIRHKELAVEGVQFHPESILTGEGKNILRNFLDR